MSHVLVEECGPNVIPKEELMLDWELNQFGLVPVVWGHVMEVRDRNKRLFIYDDSCHE